MKRKKQDIDKLVNGILEESLVPSNYLPGDDFVSRVMDRVEDISNVPMGRYLRRALKMAASVAVFFFAANLIVLISSLNTDQAQTEMIDEWSDGFSVGQSVDWYEYYMDGRLSENQK